MILIIPGKIKGLGIILQAEGLGVEHPKVRDHQVFFDSNIRDIQAFDNSMQKLSFGKDSVFSPRCGHSVTWFKAKLSDFQKISTVSEESDVNCGLLLFGASKEGAMDDAYIITLSGEYIKLDNKLVEDWPSVRYEHGCAFDEANGQVFLYAGSVQQNVLDASFYKFSLKTLAFTRIEPKGKYVPEGRTMHDGLALVPSVGSKGRLFMFSGGSLDHCPVQENCVWIFDIANECWIRFVTSNGPSARFGHSFVTVGDKIWLYGGIEANQKLPDDLWVYHCDKNVWEKVYGFAVKPPARSGHSCVAYGDRYFFISGGLDTSQKKVRVFNDLWAFDTGNRNLLKLIMSS